MSKPEKEWGKVVLVNLNNCDKNILKSEEKLKPFASELCKLIKMKSYGPTILKRFGQGELEGYSLMQFIETSSITAHFDEFGGRAFIDVFSCKDFDEKKVLEFSKKYFNAKGGNCKVVLRS